jgi:peptide/nickel transport system substrate-binding protein
MKQLFDMRSLTIGIVVATLLILGACATQQEQQEESQALAATPVTVLGTTPVPAAVPTATPPVAAPAPVATPAPAAAMTEEGPKRGGTLNFVGAAGIGYDCHKLLTSNCVGSSDPVFSGLVYYDPTQHEINPSNVVGDLAESWDASGDGTTYTFNLKDATWNDGRPFTAEDVAYSMEHITDPDLSVLSSWFLPYDRTEVADSKTAVVHLSRPQSSFVPLLAASYSMMFRRDIVEGNDYRDSGFLVGTGPFMFKEEVPGVSLELERNPNFFKEGMPYLDGVVGHKIGDANAVFAALAADRLQLDNWCCGVGTVDGLVETQKNLPHLVIQMMPNGYGGGLAFMGQIADDKPWGDKKVRQAVNLVLDRPSLIKALTGSEHWGTYGGYIWPGLPYALPREELDALIAHDKEIEERVALAKQLMADAGYADGFDAGSVLTRAGFAEGQINLLVDLLQRHLDIKLSIEILASTGVMLEKVTSRDFDYTHEWASVALGEPDEMHGYALPGSNRNWSGYDNARFTELYNQQSASLDLAQRIDLNHELERLLLDDVPYIHLGFMSWATRHQPYVKGWVKSYGYANNAHWERVWLDN